MAYTFATVDRNNGDTFREQDLDQFMENDNHLRDETDFKVLANLSLGTLTTSLGFTFAVTVGGIACTSGTGAQFAGDVDVSSLTDGLNVMSIGGNTLRWIKTPDINFVSVWTSVAVVTEGSSLIHTINAVTIIAHREEQYW